MSHTSLRTQIILPTSLRQDIDKYRRASGESLAEYLRKAVMERIKKEKKRKTDLKKLAEEFAQFARKNRGKGGWAGVDAVKWQREIRRESEARLEKQWKGTRHQNVSS